MNKLKSIFDKANEDKNFIKRQFEEQSEGANILFVAPQLSMEHLYNFLLPYIMIYESGKANTAVTSIRGYDQDYIITSVKEPLTSQAVMWATYIVFPFSIMNLKPLYDGIRSMNPDATIVYHIDINYYETPTSHRYHQALGDSGIANIESSAIYSDLIIVRNGILEEIIDHKFQALLKTTYQEISSPPEILLQPILAHEATLKGAITAAGDSYPAYQKDKGILKGGERLRLGIYVDENNVQDFKSILPHLAKMQDEVPGNALTTVVFGPSSIIETDLLKPIRCQKEVVNSMLQYYMMLHYLNLDAFLVISEKSKFNESSLFYNNIIEACMYKIAVIFPEMYPYNAVLDPGNTGFLYADPSTLGELVLRMTEMPEKLKQVVENAYNYASTDFHYTDDTIQDTLDSLTEADDTEVLTEDQPEQ